VWRDADFLRLWGAQTLSQIGSQVSGLALPLVAILSAEASRAQESEQLQLWLDVQMRPNRLCLLLAVAGALASTASAAPKRALVITVKSVETQWSAIDAPPKEMGAGKFSANDVIVMRDNLFNRAPQLGRPAGAKIGTDLSRLRFLSGTVGVVVGSATFPGGTVRFKGRFSRTAKGLALTITGGTGRYAGARGTVTEPATDSDPQNATNTYHVRLP